MENIFKDSMQQHSIFSWNKMGNIAEGRGSLGEDMLVQVYRLMCFALLEVLQQNQGENKADYLFNESGRLAGYELAQNCLTLTVPFDDFCTELAAKMLELRIGILKRESYNSATNTMVFTLENDISCSGLKQTGKSTCRFEEGFLAGVFYAYTGKDHIFEEISCWSLGDTVCRFKGRVAG